MNHELTLALRKYLDARQNMFAPCLADESGRAIAAVLTQIPSPNATQQLARLRSERRNQGNTPLVGQKRTTEYLHLYTDIYCNLTQIQHQ